jgi:hypothetical protein
LAQTFHGWKKLQRDKSPLRQVCEAKGLKYGWIAKQLGISQGYFNHIEAGRRPAPPWYYERLARVLQVPVEMIRPEPEPVEVPA